jgi:hypothetical protein
MSLPYLGCVFAAVAIYSRMGWVVAHRLRQPTCRLCLHRGCCPLRQACFWDPSAKYCYEVPEQGDSDPQLVVI